MTKISIHNIFLILAAFFGLQYSLITPPFQVPDEINHFFRAYQISEGYFKSIKLNDRVGGYIPESLGLFTDSYRLFTLNPYSKLNFDYLSSTKKISLQPEKKIFKDFPNTALYSPVSYICQSITIYFLRIFNCRPFYLLYASRITTLISWIILVYFSIKILPVNKMLFAFLALLPMSLSINSSISADVMTNGLSFLFIAYILKVAFKNEHFTKKDFLIISIIVIFLGFAKLIYVALVLLFLIIPKSKFSSIKTYSMVFILLLVLGIGSSVIWKRNIDSLYTPYDKYSKQYRDDTIIADGVDMGKQINFINENKLRTIKIFVHSYRDEFNYMTVSYIGILGWGDTNLPNWFIIINYIIIFLLVITANVEKFSFNIYQRALLLLVFIFITILIMLSQYLSWDKVGSTNVYPLIGRYFIPVFPLAFLAIVNQRLHIPSNFLKYTFVFICVISGIYVISFLYNRFYYNYKTEKKWEIFRDVDQIQKNNEIFVIEGKDTIVRGSSLIATNEKSYSGNYSIKLTSHNKYGFTHIIKNAKKDDIISVSAKRLGKYGEIVFSEFANGGLFYSSSKTFLERNTDWKQVEAEFFVPKNMLKTELRVYILYPENDSAYFDDFRISYFKKK